jgi:hypothetical protein
MKIFTHQRFHLTFNNRHSENAKLKEQMNVFLKNYILKGIFIFGCLLMYGRVDAQSNLSIGQWKSHLSYKAGRLVTQSPQNVIYASEQGIFTISKDDISVQFLSKEDGLTEVNVNHLFYDTKHEQLIIVYIDNSIDVVRKTEIYNIPFVKTNTSILGSKTINDFFVTEAGEGYFATDFGVLGFDTEKLEFTFTTFTNLKVTSVARIGDVLYAGTEEGLYSVSVKGSNLTDFNIWKPIPANGGPPDYYTVQSLAVKYNKLFTLIDDKIYIAGADGKFKEIYTPQNNDEDIKYLSDDGSQIIAGIENNSQSRTIFIDKDSKITERGTGCVNRGVYAVEDEKGRVWYADQWEPVRYTEGKITGECKRLTFQVPFTNEASSVRFKKNKAYFGSNGVNDDYLYKFTRYGFYTLEDNKWENFNSNIPEIQTLEFLHLLTLAPHPKNPEVFLGSYYNGIIKYDEVTKKVTHWNKDNSILGGTVGDDARTRIAGLTFDKNENLWISNFGAPKPLAVKTKEDTWHSFAVPGNTTLGEIVIDRYGNKWIAVIGIGGGVLVFNEGAKIADPTDDKMRFISRNNSEIKGNKVNCLVVDLEGSVWVGTDLGPVVFDCQDPFNESCKGNTRKVVVDGIPALLLRDEDILSIEVDGGNRKWFGTRNGIFVQSPDGITQEAKWEVKNSPLLNNKVTDLAFNPLSGEMFIITPSGIQSYKTESTGGTITHDPSSVYAYPNPVRPDYHGPIAIKGLVRDANVKITDINGRLIFETKAFGGQAIWDGMDYNGKKAATGVYLVFSANENTALSPDSFVTKILIVN